MHPNGQEHHACANTGVHTDVCVVVATAGLLGFTPGKCIHASHHGSSPKTNVHAAPTEFIDDTSGIERKKSFSN